MELSASITEHAPSILPTDLGTSNRGSYTLMRPVRRRSLIIHLHLDQLEAVQSSRRHLGHGSFSSCESESDAVGDRRSVSGHKDG